MDETTFLNTLREEFNSFTLDNAIITSKSLENKRLYNIKQILAYAYYDILYKYINKEYDADNNFFSEIILNEIIEKINNIMDSYLYADFS